VKRDRLPLGVIGELGRLGVTADQLHPIQHGLVGILAAELQHLQQPDQPTAVVVGVGGPVGRLHRPAIRRARRLVLSHQIPQILLAHHREHHGAHQIIRVGKCRIGHPEQQPLLALHPLERVHQLASHPALGAGPDPVHRGQQQGHQRIGDLAAATVQQRRQQRHLKLRRMRPGVAGRLSHRLVPPLPHDPRRHVAEQAVRQPEGDDGRQLPDLTQHRRQTDRPRRRLDLPQQVRLLVVTAIIARPDQRQQLADRLRGQPACDPACQQLAGLRQRRLHIPVGLIRRRRLQRAQPALGQELLPDQLIAPFPLRRAASEELHHLGPILFTAKPEPEVRPDLVAMTLDSPPRPVVARQLRRIGLHRACHELHGIRVQFAMVAGEAPKAAIEPQQQRERELAIAVLDRDQVDLVCAEGPVFDQLTEAEWSKATHKRSSSRTSHRASHMITNLAPGRTVLTNAPTRRQRSHPPQHQDARPPAEPSP
jgi:hypothetical protein